MPTRDLPALLWLLAGLAAFGPYLAARWRSRTAAAPTLDRSGVAWQLGLAVVLATALYLLAPQPPKGMLAAGGALVGTLLGMFLHQGQAARLAAAEAGREPLARSGVLVLGLTLVDALVPDPVLASYALLGALTGVALAAVTGRETTVLAGRTLVLAALVGAASIWGDRTLPAASLGSAWGLAAGGLVLGTSYVASFAAVPARMLLATLVAGTLGAALGFWTLHLTPQLALALPAGLLAALALAGAAWLVTRVAARLPWADLLLVLVAGGLVLLANRTLGMTGLALAGLGLIPLALAPGLGTRLFAVLGALVATRAMLQLYLDRTYLHQEGADLTHPYTAAGYVGALVLPFVLLRLERLAPSGLRALAALALMLVPLGLGYFTHAGPVGSYLAASLGVMLVGGLAATEAAPELPEALAPYLVGGVGISLLSGAWQLQVFNAPRLERVLVFLVLVAITGGIALWASLRPRPEVA